MKKCVGRDISVRSVLSATTDISFGRANASRVNPFGVIVDN